MPATRMNTERFTRSAKSFLLILPIGLGGCAGLGMAPDAPRVALEGDVGPTLAEGETAAIMLSRNRAGEALPVTLTLAAKATSADDFRLEGVEAAGEGRFVVTLPAGETEARFSLIAVDDVHAEAAERLELRIERSERYRIDRSRRKAAWEFPANDFAVITTADRGEGSLRQAIENANAFGQGATITFDSEAGPFGPPQRIELGKPLPVLTGDYTIEGYVEDMLWKASGVIISGMDQRRVFEVAPGANIAIRNLTVAEGKARDGAGILNRGDLVVSGVTFENNQARRAGGAILNAEGRLYLVNSTLTGNQAGRHGAGLASEAPVSVVHATFESNLLESDSDGAHALHSTGPLHLVNSVLWSGEGRLDCQAEPSATPEQGHNLVGRHRNCGTPLLEEDPEFEGLNYFNGPARTTALSGRSPAINLAENSLSVDETGQPLRWDQRGNGDPRFVAGYADLGAFEVQAFPVLRVNTAEETGLRSCFPSNNASCPLRAAIELALADDRGRETVIEFDPDSLPDPAIITLERPLPDIDRVLTLKAPEGYAITVRVPAGAPLPGDNLQLAGVRIVPY